MLVQETIARIWYTVSLVMHALSMFLSSKLINIFVLIIMLEMVLVTCWIHLGEIAKVGNHRTPLGNSVKDNYRT